MLADALNKQVGRYGALLANSMVARHVQTAGAPKGE